MTRAKKTGKKSVGTATTALDCNSVVPEVRPDYEAAFERLRNLCKHLCAGRLSSGGIWVSGTAGVSKSRSVIETLEAESAKPDASFVYELHRGHCSTVGLISILHAATIKASETGKRVVLLLDDMDAAVSHYNIAKSMLAPLSESRIVSFASTRLPPNLPQRFELGPSVQAIVVTNIDLSQPKNEHLKAVLSRCHLVSVTVSPSQMVQMIRDKLVPASFMESTIQDRKFVFSKLERAASQSTSSITLRIFHQLLELHLLGEDLDLHLDLLLPPSDDLRLLREALRRGDTDSDCAAIWMKKSGRSIRAWYYAKRRLAAWI